MDNKLSSPTQTTDFFRPVYCILGLPFDSITLDQAVAAIRKSAMEKNRLFFSTPNLNFLIGCLDDPDFRDSVIQSDLSVADGMPIVWIARLLGLPISERVAGSSIFEALQISHNIQLSTYFFGGMNGVAQKACEKLNQYGSPSRCVGFKSPGFGSINDLSTPSILEEINTSNADFLVVALGAKKGQAWIQKNLLQLTPPIVSHLGAVVNFVGGTISRAPAIIQRLGLEWLWRIKEEPLLWRRYFQDGIRLLQLLATRIFPIFVDRILRSRLSKGIMAEVKVQRSIDSFNIGLIGDFCNDDHTSLRQALSEATRTGTNIKIDFTNVGCTNSSFIALLMLAYGHQKKIGRGFLVYNPPKQFRRALKLNSAGYLLLPVTDASAVTKRY